MSIRVHFHTDNYWFSGSETTLLVLLEAAFNGIDIDPVFTYRPWPGYEPGLRRNLAPSVVARPLALPDPAAWKAAAIGTGGPVRAAGVRAVARLLPLRKASLALDVIKLERLFRETAPDLVHINNGGFPGAISCHAAALAAHRAGVQAIVYVVNNLAYGYDRPGRWGDWAIERRLSKVVTTFVTGSAVAADRLCDVLSLDTDRVAVIPNTIFDRSADSIAAADAFPDGPLLAVIARLEARKGHAVLFDALRRMSTRATLLVAGDGPDAAALEQAAAAAGVARQVRFLGHCGDVWPLLRRADAVVLPSVGAEDFPVVVLEAMAAARPVVASRIAGTVEQIVDGETGRLVAPGDPAGLAAALDDVLRQPPQARAMGAAGRQRYEEHFQPDHVVGRYMDLYRRLASVAVR